MERNWNDNVETRCLWLERRGGDVCSFSQPCVIKCTFLCICFWSAAGDGEQLRKSVVMIMLLLLWSLVQEGKASLSDLSPVFLLNQPVFLHVSLWQRSRRKSNGFIAHPYKQLFWILIRYGELTTSQNQHTFLGGRGKGSANSLFEASSCVEIYLHKQDIEPQMWSHILTSTSHIIHFGLGMHSSLYVITFLLSLIHNTSFLHAKQSFLFSVWFS